MDNPSIQVTWTGPTSFEVRANGLLLATYRSEHIGGMSELHNTCRLLARLADVLSLNHREERTRG